VPDYGVVAFMPTDGMTAEKTSENGYLAPFRHADEAASPGFYEVTLTSGIVVQVTSTPRAAAFRFTFPAGMDPVLVVDLSHTLGNGAVRDAAIAIDPATGAGAGSLHVDGDLSERFGGFPVFAAWAVSPAPTEAGTWHDGTLQTGMESANGDDVGGFIAFAPGTATADLRVGVSLVDAEGAAGNLQAEIPGFDFDGVRTAAEATWRESLGRLEVAGVPEDEVPLLATAAYHALLMPTLQSDADGRYRRVDGTIGSTAGARYSDFSLWDTYRTLHPWLLLAEDPRNADFADSLLGFAREGGAFPRWALANGDIHSMIGDPGVIVMAEMGAKGIAFDEEAAYAFARATAFGPATGPVGGRGTVDGYLAVGYVPADEGSGSVARTLEFASADFALAGWARRLGKTDDADLLETRARAAWRAHWNPQSGFLHPRNRDGSWADLGDPLAYDTHYVEGNAWQYLWMVPHDPDGLAEAMGGADAAVQRLETFFGSSEAEEPLLGLRSWYWHGNEPDLVAPWMFVPWGRPVRAVHWVDWIVDTMYGTAADGLAGNDDAGTLSAWLWFAAAGLYPVPGTDVYWIGAPRYERMALRRASGTLTILASPAPAANRVPLSVSLDGTPLDRYWVRHAELYGEHTLAVSLGP
jgi:predicted alpha-1,2-mannosidase